MAWQMQITNVLGVHRPILPQNTPRVIGDLIALMANGRVPSSQTASRDKYTAYLEETGDMDLYRDTRAWFERLDEWRQGENVQAAMTQALRECEVVLWHRDVLSSLAETLPAFRGVPLTLENTPQSPQLWLRQYARRADYHEIEDILAHESDPYAQYWFIGQLLLPLDLRGVAATICGSIYINIRPSAREVVYHMNADFLPHGDMWHSLERHSLRDLGILVMDPEKILGPFAFLNSTIARLDPAPRPTRAERKLARRLGRHIPTVQTVLLRRIEPAPPSSLGESRAVDWTCQWDVRGHWRKVRNREDRIWVRSHRKGPHDKPLKARPIALAAR